MRRLKENNSGFSLVEVMIAVMILAIVVTPFLHSFTTTANTNRKAKEIHRATVLAQSIMENCKAETLEDLAMQFDYPKNTAAGFRIMDTYRVNGGGADWFNGVMEYRTASQIELDGTETILYNPVVKFQDTSLASLPLEEKIERVTASTLFPLDSDTPASDETDFLAQTDGVYYFALHDVAADKASYDVLVQLDAGEYKAGGGKSQDPDAADPNDPTAYNAHELAQLPVIDPEKDALCVQKDEYTANAVAEFYAQLHADILPEVKPGVDAAHPTATPTEKQALYKEAIENRIRNGLKRDITLTIKKIGTATSVNVRYHYTFKRLPGDAPREYKKEMTAFDSPTEDKPLRNVYLYYYPLYGRGSTGDDLITIVNEDRVPIDLFLFKQTRDGAAAPSNADETNYKMTLKFEESAAGMDETKLSTTLHTNLGLNLAMNPGDPNYNLADTGNWNIQMNGVPKSLAAMEVDNILGIDAQDRVFDLKVMIYEKDAHNANYPEDQKIATIEGTKLK